MKRFDKQSNLNLVKLDFQQFCSYNVRMYDMNFFKKNFILLKICM